MKLFHVFSVLLVVVLLSSCMSVHTADVTESAVAKVAAPVEEVSGADEFVLGAGDEISIQVWRNSDLDRTVQIDPAGNVNLSPIGVVRAMDLTPSDLARRVEELLAEKYLVNPRVAVNATDVQSRKVFIMGEVVSPGAFLFDPRMSLLEAISTAGGFTRDANRSKVLLARRDGENMRVSSVDVKSGLREGEGGERLLLRSRDVIYIPPSRIANVERFLAHFENIVRPFSTLAGAIVLGDDAVRVFSGDDQSDETRKTSVAIEP